MTRKPSLFTRRHAMKTSGLLCTAAMLGSAPSATAEERRTDIREILRDRVEKTPFVDTHEHLMEEETRLGNLVHFKKADDWSFLLSHYIDSDLLSAGMPQHDYDAFLSPDIDPFDKWKYLEPFWPHVRYTGYGQAVDIAIRKIYGIEGLSKDTIKPLQEAYRKTVQAGFYKTILQDIAGIESCQVNSLTAPFNETKQPQLLMQDLNITGMHMGPGFNTYANPAGIDPKELSDWHRVIDWWFAKYGLYATAVKVQSAYSRNIDFDQIPAEEAAPVYRKKRNEEPCSAEEIKKLEDHLFWYAVGKATEHNLPVKIHTGYYAGANRMPLSRLQGNPGAATELCRLAPDTKFVFMHIGYPFYEEFIAAAKQYTNCHIDMCWAWIVSPVAGVNFLKQYLVTAPSNKVLTFGGDYFPVEPVVGHAEIARRGIVNSLVQLVDEGWLTLSAAEGLVEPLLRGNAHSLFHLEEKKKAMAQAPWLAG